MPSMSDNSRASRTTPRESIPLHVRSLISDNGEYRRYPNPGSRTVADLVTTITWVTHGALPANLGALIVKFTTGWHYVRIQQFKLVTDYELRTYYCPRTGDPLYMYNEPFGSKAVRNDPIASEVAPFVGISDAGHVLTTVLQALIVAYAY